MNVTIENIGPCRRLMRVEADVNEVQNAQEEVTRDFLKHASIPGFRPGKAPRDMVVRRYKKEIEEETWDKIVRDLYKAAVQKEGLRVYEIQDMEKIQFVPGQPAQFAVTLEIEPEFELPEYRQIPVTVQTRQITDADVDKAVEGLRQHAATFEKVERPATAEDTLIVNFTGTLEGKPLSEKLGPAVKNLEAGANFWMHARREFAPQVFSQLVGASAGEKRTIIATFPADYPIKEVAGCPVKYEVEVVEVRELKLPALDDAFAKSYEAADLNALRAGVRRDLENDEKYQRQQQIKEQVIKWLVEKLHFELPQSAVAEQTRRTIYNIVADMQRRGVKPEAIEQEKEQIYQYAAAQAVPQVKLQFILSRIAEKEGIKVLKEELAQALTQLAYQRQISPDELAREMQKTGQLVAIHQDLLRNNALDFLMAHAAVTEVPATAQPQAPATNPS